MGRVLKELPSDTDLALNLLLVDARGTPLAVRLYNIGKVSRTSLSYFLAFVL